MESEEAIKELNTIGDIVRGMGNPEEWGIDQWEDLLLMQQRASDILVASEVRCSICEQAIVGIPAAKVVALTNLLCPNCTMGNPIEREGVIRDRWNGVRHV